jgi:hypothetical protein
MNPKDQARAWLDERCGRDVHVETRFVNSDATPLVNAGPLRRGGSTHSEPVEGDLASRDLYQVGTASYNLADLPEEMEVHVRTEPPERLELTFDDGTSLLITVVIATSKEGTEN